MVGMLRVLAEKVEWEWDVVRELMVSGVITSGWTVTPRNLASAQFAQLYFYDPELATNIRVGHYNGILQASILQRELLKEIKTW